MHLADNLIALLVDNAVAELKFNPFWMNEPRDWHGRWTAGAGGNRHANTLVASADTGSSGVTPPPGSGTGLNTDTAQLLQYLQDPSKDPPVAGLDVTLLRPEDVIAKAIGKDPQRQREYAQWLLDLAKWGWNNGDLKNWKDFGYGSDMPNVPWPSFLPSRNDRYWDDQDIFDDIWDQMAIIIHSFNIVPPNLYPVDILQQVIFGQKPHQLVVTADTSPPGMSFQGNQGPQKLRGPSVPPGQGSPKETIRAQPASHGGSNPTPQTRAEDIIMENARGPVGNIARAIGRNTSRQDQYARFLFIQAASDLDPDRYENQYIPQHPELGNGTFYKPDKNAQKAIDHDVEVFKKAIQAAGGIDAWEKMRLEGGLNERDLMFPEIKPLPGPPGATIGGPKGNIRSAINFSKTTRDTRFAEYASYLVSLADHLSRPDMVVKPSFPEWVPSIPNREARNSLGKDLAIVQDELKKLNGNLDDYDYGNLRDRLMGKTKKVPGNQRVAHQAQGSGSNSGLLPITGESSGSTGGLLPPVRSLLSPQEITDLVAKAMANLKYNPHWMDEPRDWHGRWTTSGGGSAGGGAGGSPRPKPPPRYDRPKTGNPPRVIDITVGGTDPTAGGGGQGSTDSLPPPPPPPEPIRPPSAGAGNVGQMSDVEKQILQNQKVIKVTDLTPQQRLDQTRNLLDIGRQVSSLIQPSRQTRNDMRKAVPTQGPDSINQRRKEWMDYMRAWVAMAISGGNPATVPAPPWVTQIPPISDSSTKGVLKIRDVIINPSNKKIINAATVLDYLIQNGNWNYSNGAKW